jgi:hypothetical protein
MENGPCSSKRWSSTATIAEKWWNCDGSRGNRHQDAALDGCWLKYPRELVRTTDDQPKTSWNFYRNPFKTAKISFFNHHFDPCLPVSTMLTTWYILRLEKHDLFLKKTGFGETDWEKNQSRGVPAITHHLPIISPAVGLRWAISFGVACERQASTANWGAGKTRGGRKPTVPNMFKGCEMNCIKNQE